MRRMKLSVLALGLAVMGNLPAVAGSHTWDVFEVFSNADGTIQFIELREMNGGTAEIGVGGHNLTSNTRTYLIPSNVASPTSFKHILFATPAFAALPGAPTPDFIFPSGVVPFFSVSGDTISYDPWDIFTFGAGQLPTDGINSLNDNGTTGPNTPENYAGQVGSVDASPGPAGVPDGRSGSTPVKVTKLTVSGSSLSVTWDTSTCTGGDHQILYGEKAHLPAAPGGAFSLLGSVCGLGGTSPYVWNPAPSPTGGTGLVWWLVSLKGSSNREGSWGKSSTGAERVGPGPGGSSGQCGVTTRDLSNSCGH